MAQPGEDVDFNFSFDEEETGGARKGGANAAGGGFGGVPPVRGREAAAPPPQGMHDEFDALPDNPTGFGADPVAHQVGDSFDDVDAGDDHVGSRTAFGEQEHIEGAPRIYAEAEGDQFAASDEPIENFDSDGHDDFDHATGDHVAGEVHSDEDDENVLRHAEHHGDEDRDLENAPVAAQRSLLSRLIMPVGGIALLGAVGYGAWSYVSPVFFGQPAVQTAQGPQRIQMPPTTTMPNGMPAGGSPAVQRPPMPQESQAQPRPPVQQAMQRPAPAQQPSAQTPGTQPIQVASAVPDGMTGMNRPSQGGADEALKGISSQLEVIGANIGRVNSRLEVLERAAQADRSDFSGRIAALESKGPASAPAGKAPVATSSPIMPSVVSMEAKTSPAKETKAPSLVSEPKKTKAVTKAEAVDEDTAPKARRGKGRSRHAAKSDDGSDPSDVAMAGDEPPAKPMRISGLRLKAVSEINGRSMVSVQTAKGRTEEFTVGQSIPGAGEIQSIRQNGGSWVVVTSRGVIVE
ncbi:hypothetical protein ACVIGB_000695 [Bradyrhizobium sp. USDA 4341]